MSKGYHIFISQRYPGYVRRMSVVPLRLDVRGMYAGCQQWTSTRISAGLKKVSTKGHPGMSALDICGRFTDIRWTLTGRPLSWRVHTSCNTRAVKAPYYDCTESYTHPQQFFHRSHDAKTRIHHTSFLAVSSAQAVHSRHSNPSPQRPRTLHSNNPYHHPPPRPVLPPFLSSVSCPPWSFLVPS